MINNFDGFCINDTDLVKITKTEVVGLQKLKWLILTVVEKQITYDTFEQIQCITLTSLALGIIYCTTIDLYKICLHYYVLWSAKHVTTLEQVTRIGRLVLPLARDLQ